MKDQDFLKKLQSEAKIQADLSQDFLFPRRFSALTSFVLNHSLPVLLFLSLFAALITLIIFNP